jgi:hypothetical protein
MVNSRLVMMHNFILDVTLLSASASATSEGSIFWAHRCISICSALVHPLTSTTHFCCCPLHRDSASYSHLDGHTQPISCYNRPLRASIQLRNVAVNLQDAKDGVVLANDDVVARDSCGRSTRLPVEDSCLVRRVAIFQEPREITIWRFIFRVAAPRSRVSERAHDTCDRTCIPSQLSYWQHDEAKNMPATH